jgi:hypothetical protein
VIRPLRRRHRVLILVVGIAAAILVILGLLARRPVPEMDALPAGVRTAAEGRGP